MKAVFVSGLLFIMAIYTTAFPSKNKGMIDYRQLGDSLSLQAQQALIKNLLSAVEKGGAAYAVDFCNENAAPLTKSLSQKYNVAIQRISAKNRNPNNTASPFDKKMLDLFNAGSLKDTLVSTSKGYVYYKPIKIGMPTCLQCHGKPNRDIETATLKTIQRHYRFDKATGYAMGELRGAWKLTFETP
ncbi:MAG: DUF3365 domain-containing protein [Spirosomataceae bacterium]